jgi:hypothetical protein
VRELLQQQVPEHVQKNWWMRPGLAQLPFGRRSSGGLGIPSTWCVTPGVKQLRTWLEEIHRQHHNVIRQNS